MTLFSLFVFIILLYLESEKTHYDVHLKPPKPLLRSRNTRKNKENMESGEVHLKGTLTLFHLLLYKTFKGLFTIIVTICYVSVLSRIRKDHR